MWIDRALCAIVPFSVLCIGGCGGSSSDGEDGGSVIQPALSISLNDEDRFHGKLRGQIEVRPAMDETGITHYRLIWTDAERKPIDGEAVAELQPEPSGQLLTYTLSESISIPENAAFLRVLSIGTQNQVVEGALWQIQDYIVEAPEIVSVFDSDPQHKQFGGYVKANIHTGTDVDEYSFYWADKSGTPLPELDPLLTVSADQPFNTPHKFEFTKDTPIPPDAVNIVAAASDLTGTQYYADAFYSFTEWVASTTIRIMGKYQLDTNETVMEIVTTSHLPNQADTWLVRTYIPDSSYANESEPEALGEDNLLIQTSQFNLNDFLQDHRGVEKVKLLAELKVEHEGESIVEREELVIDRAKLQARIDPIADLQLTATETRYVSKPEPQPPQLEGQFLGRVGTQEGETSTYLLYWADEQGNLMEEIENVSMLGGGPYSSLDVKDLQIPSRAKMLVLSSDNHSSGSLYGPGLAFLDSRIQESFATETIVDNEGKEYLKVASTIHTIEPVTTLYLDSLLRNDKGQQIGLLGVGRANDNDAVTATTAVLLNSLLEQPDALVFLDRAIVLNDWYGTDYRYREYWYKAIDLINNL